ncbi:hypothetical protein INR49_030978 [Caranx melampygus]|nr:hypothetical protein INR49_030978 [Caranx melampygus]
MTLNEKWKMPEPCPSSAMTKNVFGCHVYVSVLNMFRCVSRKRQAGGWCEPISSSETLRTCPAVTGSWFGLCTCQRLEVEQRTDSGSAAPRLHIMG